LERVDLQQADNQERRFSQALSLPKWRLLSHREDEPLYPGNPRLLLAEDRVDLMESIETSPEGRELSSSTSSRGGLFHS
jgi:hypothetical protein